MNNNSANLSAFCRSIGLIYDRTASGAEPVGSTFLVAEKKAATLASLMLPFINNPEALKVSIPSAEREFGVSAIHLHRLFDRGFVRKTIFQGTLGNAPEAALQKYNVCVLDLEEKVGPISEAQIEQVSAALRYPINLSDEGFRGSLSEIELPLVIQTVNNAKKQGILYICDEMHRPIAQIYCQNGLVVSAKYRALTNELAMFQIIEKRLTGRFIFRAGKPPAWMPARPISRTTDTILIEAMRRQDEINALKKHLGTNDFYFVRAYKQLYLDGISPEGRKYAETIWRALDGTTPADQLWCLVPLDDYTIFATLHEMYSTNQVMRVPLSGTAQFVIPKMPEEGYAPAFLSSTPLPLGLTLPLNAFDTISSVGIDPQSSRPRVKVGALLGAIDPYDAIHLLHDIPLLPWASGSPLLKDDLVIGMHCGVVPNSSAVDNTSGVLQQMLWCEAIAQVVKEIPGAVLPFAPPTVGLSPQNPNSTAARLAAMPAPGAAPTDTAARLAALPNPAAGPNDTGARLKAVPNQAANVNETANRLPAFPEPASGANDTASRLKALPNPAAGAIDTAARLGALPGPAGAPSETASRLRGMPPPDLHLASNAPTIERSQFDTKKRQPVVASTENLPGCREIASLKCAICGERTFSSARRCTRCANEFVPQLKKGQKGVKLDLALPIAAAIVVALAATAAFAWTRLPQPIFAEMEVMSVPTKPWAELFIMKGDSSTGKWERTPNNSKYVPSDLCHFRLKSNKPCWVYLLTKGSSEGKASLPIKEVKRMADGESLTFPEYISEVRGGKTYLQGMNFGGPPGSDKMIALVCNPKELDWLKDVNNVDATYERATTALALSGGNGVLVSENQIMPEGVANDESKTESGSSGRDTEMVYITSVTANH